MTLQWETLFTEAGGNEDRKCHTLYFAEQSETAATTRCQALKTNGAGKRHDSGKQLSPYPCALLSTLKAPRTKCLLTFASGAGSAARAVWAAVFTW